MTQKIERTQLTLWKSSDAAIRTPGGLVGWEEWLDGEKSRIENDGGECKIKKRTGKSSELALFIKSENS